MKARKQYRVLSKIFELIVMKEREKKTEFFFQKTQMTEYFQGIVEFKLPSKSYQDMKEK